MIEFSGRQEKGWNILNILSPEQTFQCPCRKYNACHSTSGSTEAVMVMLGQTVYLVTLFGIVYGTILL